MELYHLQLTPILQSLHDAVLQDLIKITLQFGVGDWQKLRDELEVAMMASAIVMATRPVINRCRRRLQRMADWTLR